MIYDSAYRNVQEVKKVKERCPVMVDFGHLSDEVAELLFDVHEHVDAMIGYADLYVHMKEPENIYDGAFLPEEYWERFKAIMEKTDNPEDVKALRNIEEVGEYLKQLTSLMFEEE